MAKLYIGNTAYKVMLGDNSGHIADLPTIVWNQLANGPIIIGGATKTYENGYTTCVLKNGEAQVRMLDQYIQDGFVSGDKILRISHCPEYHVANASFDTLRLIAIWNNTKKSAANTTSNIVYRSTDTVAVISTLNDATESTDKCGFYFDLNNAAAFAHTTDDYFVASYMIFNLTKMFGAGNEPTSVEQFQQWFIDNIGPLDTYYPYNAGEEIKVKYLPKYM